MGCHLRTIQRRHLSVCWPTRRDHCRNRLETEKCPEIRTCAVLNHPGISYLSFLNVSGERSETYTERCPSPHYVPQYSRGRSLFRAPRYKTRNDRETRHSRVQLASPISRIGNLNRLRLPPSSAPVTLIVEYISKPCIETICILRNLGQRPAVPTI